VAGNPRIEFVLEAIQAAVAIVRTQPVSPESDRLAREAISLRQAVEGWRRSPPSRALREDTMKRVLRLHVAAATLTRLGPSPAEAATALASSGVLDENDRPTAPPPFDIEAFARETTAPDSERRIPSEPPTQRRQGQSEADRNVAKGPTSIERDVDRALAPLAESPHATFEPVTARRPSLEVEMSLAAPAPAPAPAARAPGQRSFSPSSIERAVLGAVDSPVVTQRDIQDPTAEMLECYAVADYAGAITLADLVLADAPENLVALECRSKSSTALEGIYAARLGSMSHVPIVVMTTVEIDRLEIDHRAGFLLSLIDGASSLEAVLDVCGMPRLDALRILRELVQRGAIRLGRLSG
jgi:hypothetical protein